MRMMRRAGLLASLKLNIQYTGAYTQKEVTMDGSSYLLLEITGNGTLTTGKTVTGDIWFCGAGGNGDSGEGNGAGGGGAYCVGLNNKSFNTISIEIGQPGSNNLLGGNTILTVGSTTYTAYGGNRDSSGSSSHSDGGTGGGGSMDFNGGSGDGVSKKPFNSTYFTYPYCDGGGGGGVYNTKKSYYYKGGNGGTNGGNGTNAVSTSASGVGGGGAKGGQYGGRGGYKCPSTLGIGILTQPATAATGYGSGGGGGYWYKTDEDSIGSDGASGYQGVCFIRIPISTTSKNYTITQEGTYGWTKGSVTNPDSSLYDGVYQSTNAGVNSSYAVAKITFTGYTTFNVYIRSYAEGNYDYTIASTLDAATYPIASDSSTAQSSTKGSQTSGTTLSSYTKVTYTTDGSEHYIYIVFRKDNSQHANADLGYFLIEK